LGTEDYRLLPGAVAVFACTNEACEKIHRAECPEGIEAETYFCECPFCGEMKAEIVDVEKEGNLP